MRSWYVGGKCFLVNCAFVENFCALIIPGEHMFFDFVLPGVLITESFGSSRKCDQSRNDVSKKCWRAHFARSQVIEKDERQA